MAVIAGGCTTRDADHGSGASSSASASTQSDTSTEATTSGGEAPFSSTSSPVTAGRLGASYRSGCPVAPQDLALLRLSYITFAGTTATGELIVAAVLADVVVAVFAELYRLRFPIRSMQTVEAFGADDDASMAADNTSAFNCRPFER